MKTLAKRISRQQRALRLSAIVNAYSAFTQMELGRCLLKSKNDWSQAEKTKDLIQFFWPDRELKVEDFIHNKNEQADKVIDKYEEYKAWIPVIEFLGVPGKTVEAFCRNVDKANSIWMLKTLGHLHYPLYFSALNRYLGGEISKEDLKKSFVEYSILDGSTRPIDSRLFRRSIVKIEKLIDEIMTKQAHRRGVTVNEFINENRLKGVIGAPF